MILLFLGVNSLLGQHEPGALKILGKIQQVTETNQDYTYDLDCRLYSGWESDCLMETQSGKIDRKRQQILVSFAHMEYLLTENEMFALDHNTKLAMLSARPVQDPTAQLSPDLAQMLKECVKLSTIDDNTLELVFDRGQFQRARIHYRTETFLMEKVQLFFTEAVASDKCAVSEPPRMDITYRNWKMTPSRSSNAFSISRFMEKKDGQWTLSGKWADYRFLSSL
ncbi:MAG: hypothetical protein AAF206_14215 [Bacteroidota bacterium]